MDVGRDDPIRNVDRKITFKELKIISHPLALFYLPLRTPCQAPNNVSSQDAIQKISHVDIHRSGCVTANRLWRRRWQQRKRQHLTTHQQCGQ